MKLRQRLDLLHSHPAFSVAEKIVSTLQKQGYATVFAGGCVRDSLLGETSRDLDVATAAHPEVVEASFARTLAVGKAFGTIVVVEDHFNIEVTTFRKEGPYLDGRHPAHVGFTDMEEDARRRDFTVNALFYDPMDCELIDYADGLSDLRAHRLRTVGGPEERFREDRLRMLRAVRFVAQLGFQLDPQALAAIRRLHADLRTVSVERILSEVKRLLSALYLKQGLNGLLTSRLAEVFWPEILHLSIDELNSFPRFLSWENAFSAIALVAGHENPEPRLRSWKVSRESLRRILGQMQGARTLIRPESTRAERIKALGRDDFAEVLVLASGLLARAGRDSESELERWIAEYRRVADQDGNLPPPWLNGGDLIQLGMAPGVEIGKILSAVYEAQLEGHIHSREEALARAHEMWSAGSASSGLAGSKSE